MIKCGLYFQKAASVKRVATKRGTTLKTESSEAGSDCTDEATPPKRHKPQHDAHKFDTNFLSLHPVIIRIVVIN